MNLRNIFTFLLLLLSLNAWAQNFPEKPNRLVNDYTQTLSAEEANALEQKLLTFSDTTSTQIAVVLINDLEGDDVADYAVRLAEKWGIGQAKKNNGIILLVSVGDRKVTIQTGYGMEGALPDAIARRIIEVAIKPNFKQGNYFQGIDQATDAIIAYTKGEFKNERPKNSRKSFPFGLIGLIIFIIIVIAKKTGCGNNGQVISGRSASSPFWWLLMGGGGHVGDGYSGGGGGGFGGFGGGSFGGGGASGDW